MNARGASVADCQGSSTYYCGYSSPTDDDDGGDGDGVADVADGVREDADDAAATVAGEIVDDGTEMSRLRLQ